MDVRKDVLEFGMLPAAVLMPKFETLNAVTDLHSKLLREAEIIDGQPGNNKQTALKNPLLNCRLCERCLCEEADEDIAGRVECCV